RPALSSEADQANTPYPAPAPVAAIIPPARLVTLPCWKSTASYVEVTVPALVSVAPTPPDAARPAEPDAVMTPPARLDAATAVPVMFRPPEIVPALVRLPSSLKPPVIVPALARLPSAVIAPALSSTVAAPMLLLPRSRQAAPA